MGPLGGGRRRRRQRVGALAVCSGLVLGACAPGAGTDTPVRGARHSTTTGAPPSASSSTSAPTTTTVPEPPVTPVQWTACGALLCGSVAVPIDYDHPQSGTINIAVTMHRATDPAARIGSLVIDPGGPGVSGVSDLPAELGVLTPALTARFDIVEFDPRGVGRSSPVRCSAPSASSPSTSTPGPLPDPVPSTPAAQLALIGGDEAYASACKQYSGTLLPFVGTVDAARDLDRIRQALGDPTLAYFGHSYGTLLGAVYAEMFPTNVRAMVLDGAIDPAMSTEQMVVEQSEGFEAVLDNFLSWCTSTRCPWQPPGGDTAAALLALIAQSRTTPIPAGAGRSAGPGALYYAVLSALYTTSSWPELGRALAEATAGRGAEALSMADNYVAPSGSANAVDAETAIDCLDHPLGPGSSSIPALAGDAAVHAPFFGPLLAWGEATCAVWPVPTTRTPAPTTAVGSPPILVVGATKDPATPYVWAERLAAELQHGELVTWQGENHVAYYYSACIRAIDQAYFVAGTLPAPGTECTD